MAKVKILEIDGVRDTLTNHCRKYDVSPATVYRRVRKYNLSFEEAITLFGEIPPGYKGRKHSRPRRVRQYDGSPFTCQLTGRKVERYEVHTMDEWSEITGIKKATLFNRVHRRGFNAAISDPFDEKISRGMNMHIEWEKKGEFDSEFLGLNWNSYAEDKELE